MPIYTYSNLKTRVNAGIKGKIGVLVNARDTINAAVREVVGDIDLRSTIRKAALTPNLFSQVFEYAAPTDLKGNAIIDIQDQTDKRQKDYNLVSFEAFSRRHDQNSISVDNSNFVKKILINTLANSDKSIVLAALDSLTSGGGTWVVSSTGAENLAVDYDDFVRENASLSFDLSALAVTTAGIKNTTLNTFSLVDYVGGNGAVFVWAYINSTTNLTNYILRIGTNSSNYYSKTVTVASDGTAFQTGWNLLRFDLTSLSQTGTVTQASCSYVELYMTKTAGKVSETDYRFDGLYLKKGEKNNIIYYSKYGWQTAAGAYIENSTADSDLLVADTDEFDLIILKGTELAGNEVEETAAASGATAKFITRSKKYQRENPSVRMDFIDTVADFIRQ